MKVGMETTTFLHMHIPFTSSSLIQDGQLVKKTCVAPNFPEWGCRETASGGVCVCVCGGGGGGGWVGLSHL